MAYEKSRHELNVLCVGLSRTGTSSLKIAMETMLGGRCFDIFHTFDLDLAPAVSKILSGGTSDDELKNFFENHEFCAAKGFPFLGFWERTKNLFPSSKVILTVRDPEAWVTSIKNTIALRHGKNSYRNRLPYNLFRHLPSSWNRSTNMLQDIPLLTDLLEAVSDGRGVEFFNNWIEHVKSKVPKDRLLIYEVKDGWEPLCKFLNKPIPDIPFPKTNDKDSYKEYFLDKQMKKEVLVVLSLTAIPLVALISALAFKFSNEIMSSFDSWFNV